MVFRGRVIGRDSATSKVACPSRGYSKGTTKYPRSSGRLICLFQKCTRLARIVTQIPAIDEPILRTFCRVAPRSCTAAASNAPLCAATLGLYNLLYNNVAKRNFSILFWVPFEERVPWRCGYSYAPKYRRAVATTRQLSAEDSPTLSSSEFSFLPTHVFHRLCPSPGPGAKARYAVSASLVSIGWMRCHVLRSTMPLS